mmetsp:Transcript_22246/g.36560  ORF Transcript_22246/g.36560 Transcript_22246/m.36560 type:complete len:132 (-) Transcript_22246:374-769(-)
MGAIAKMMRNSERVGKKDGVQLFFTTLKFALRLFTLTPIIICVLVATYCFGITMHLHLQQRKKIYENYILTQTTVNGKSVFHDRFVELSVMDLRLWQVSVEKITEMKIWPVMSGKFYSSRTLLSLSLCPEE